jgi:ATP-dependent DNA helicase RecG
MFELIKGGALKNRRVGLLHGRIPTEERDATMRAFRDGQIDVLVATTVIEVGIDVPNASMMIIEHPERFGLSQLHQLRGRVGRGAEQSYCILLGDVSPEAGARLNVFVETEDGFEIARADLRLRGMGDLFGERQSGVPTFRVADPIRDEQLSAQAMIAAERVLREDPDLSMPKNLGILKVLGERYSRAMEMFKTG